MRAGTAESPTLAVAIEDSLLEILKIKSEIGQALIGKIQYPPASDPHAKRGVPLLRREVGRREMG